MTSGANVERMPSGVRSNRILLVAGGLIALQACILYGMGHLPICGCALYKALA
jgi:hypothetical protein